MGFCSSLKDMVDGRSESKGFVHRSRAIYQRFAIVIRGTAPNFQPFEGVDSYYMPDELEAEEVAGADERSRVELEGSVGEEVEERSMPSVMDLYVVRRVIQECVFSSSVSLYCAQDEIDPLHGNFLAIFRMMRRRYFSSDLSTAGPRPPKSAFMTFAIF